MHRAAFAAALAGRPAVELRHHPADIRPLGDHVSVAAVGGVEVIRVPQVHAHTGRHRFLSDGKVDGFSGKLALAKGRGEVFLEKADPVHRPEQVGAGDFRCLPRLPRNRGGRFRRELHREGRQDAEVIVSSTLAPEERAAPSSRRRGLPGQQGGIAQLAQHLRVEGKGGLQRGQEFERLLHRAFRDDFPARKGERHVKLLEPELMANLRGQYHLDVGIDGLLGIPVEGQPAFTRIDIERRFDVGKAKPRDHPRPRDALHNLGRVADALPKGRQDPDEVFFRSEGRHWTSRALRTGGCISPRHAAMQIEYKRLHSVWQVSRAR